MRQHHKEQERLDRRSALICFVLAEINRDKKKKPQPFTVDDFMPKYEAVSVKQKEQSPEDMKEQAKIITQILGGKIV